MSNLYERGPNRLYLDRNSGRAVDSVLIPGSIATLSTDVTIPPSGSVTIVLTPIDFLNNGITDTVLIQGVIGALTRSGSTYTFTPTPGLSNSVAVSTGVRIYPAQSRAQSKVNIGGIELEGVGDTLNVKAKNLALNSFGLSTGDKLSGWLIHLRDRLGQIAYGVRTNGTLAVQNIELFSRLKTKVGFDKFSGYYLVLRDVSGQIAAGIKSSGITFLNGLITNSAQVGNLKLSRKDSFDSKLLSLRDKSGQITYKLGSDGSHNFEKVKANTLVNNSAFDFLKEQFTLNNFLAYLETVQTNTYIFTASGQSNSVGADGYLDRTSSATFPNSYLDTTQPFTNVKLLDSGSAPLYDGSGDSLSLVPLVEPLKPIHGTNEPNYPGNIYGQSQASSIANEFSTKLTNFRSVFGLYGISGAGIANIKKGGTSTAWAKMLYEVNAIHTILGATTHKIGPHFFTHGEADWDNANYKANLYQYCNDLQTDLLPLVPTQKTPIPLILSQQGTFPFDYYNVGPLSSQAQLEAARDNALIYCSGPHYQRRFTQQEDIGSGVHRTAWDFRAEGIKYAQVATAVQCGIDWKPLQPNRIQMSGNRILIRFDVPFGPLRFDENIVQPLIHYHTRDANGIPNPWLAGKGFEVYATDVTYDRSQWVPINSCRIISNDEIELTIPKGWNPLFVAYAWTIFNNGGTLIPNPYATDYEIVTPGGRDRGRRGSLCDSDPYRGYDTTRVVCNVTNGSKVITTSSNAFKPIGWYFRVHGSNFADPTIVSSRQSDNQLTLSQPWTGATDTVPLIFHSDQSNYCLHFKLPINYSGN